MESQFPVFQRSGLYQGELPKFYNNPVGVITNNPTLDWHLQNLRNYGFLTIKPFEDKTWVDLKITPLAPGSGLLGLPGDYIAPSRFVRAVVLKEIPKKPGDVYGPHSGLCLEPGNYPDAQLPVALSETP